VRLSIGLVRGLTGFLNMGIISRKMLVSAYVNLLEELFEAIILIVTLD
jgi:hypothetical protein